MLKKNGFKLIIYLMLALTLSFGFAQDSQPSAALISGAEGDLSRVANAARYDIKLQLNYADASYTGQQTVTYTNTEDVALNTLYFRLFPNGGSSYGDGHLNVTNTKVDGVSAQTSLSINDTVLAVNLTKQLEPGESIKLDFNFEGLVSSKGSGYGMYQRTNSGLTMANWYPILAVYNENGWNLNPVSAVGDSVFSDMSHYNVTVSTLNSLTLAATGTAVTTSIDGDTQQQTYVSGPVREFFLFASDSVDVLSEQLDGVAVNSYAKKGETESAQQALDIAVDSVRAFNKNFGRYPYTELDVVAVATNSGIGGVEYPGIVLIGQANYADEASLQEVVSHEVAHQWWYNLVGNDTINAPWLDEALTTFSTQVYLESLADKSAANANLEYLRDSYRRTVSYQSDDIITLGLDHFEQHDGAYSAVVYNKGSLFFQTLREKIGDDAFFSALSSYYAANQYRVSNAQILLDTFVSFTNQPLADFYNEWLYSKAENDAGTTDEQLFSRLATIYAIFREDPTQVWASSYRFDKKPLLLVYRDGNGSEKHAYLLNHPEAASFPSAELVQTDPALHLPPVYKLTDLPRKEDLAEVPNFDFQFDLASTPTFVMIYNDPSVDAISAPVSPDWDSYLVHEGLHDQQFLTWEANANEVQDEANYPLSANDIASIRLETKLLIDAFKATDPELRDEALKRFVAVRSERMQTNDIVKNMDGAQERYEGTARYTEHRLAEITPNPELLSPLKLLEATLIPKASRGELAFGRFYETGAVLSLLLDQLGLDWKPLLEAGQSQYDILSNHYELTNNDSAKAELLNNARGAYDYIALQTAAIATASTVDDGYSPLDLEGDFSDGQYIEVQELEKPYEAVTSEPIARTLPEGYTLLGGFSATKDELDEFYQEAYSPSGNDVVFVDYASAEDRLRIISSVYNGSLNQAEASGWNEGSTRTSVADVDASLYSYDDEDGLYSDISFIHNGLWYNVSGSLSPKQISGIAEEIITQEATQTQSQASEVEDTTMDSKELGLADFLAGKGFKQIRYTKLPSQHAVLKVIINGVEGHFVLDSGAGATVMHEASVKKFNLSDLATQNGDVATGVGGDVALTTYALNSLSIEGIAISVQELVSTDLSYVVDALNPLSDNEIDGVIGQDILGLHHAIIDIAEDVVYLRP